MPNITWFGATIKKGFFFAQIGDIEGASQEYFHIIGQNCGEITLSRTQNAP